MPLTPKQAFKLAFLNACLDQGLTLAEVKSLVKAAAAKQAAGVLETLLRPVNMAMDGISNLGSTAKLVGGIGLLAAPPAIGAGLGYGAAKLTDWDDMDAEEAKKRELIDTYRRFSNQAQLARAARLRREQRQPSFSRI